MAGKKIRSTVIVDPDIWREVRIECIERNIEISQFVEMALKKELVSSLDERRAKIESLIAKFQIDSKPLTEQQRPPPSQRQPQSQQLQQQQPQSTDEQKLLQWEQQRQQQPQQFKDIFKQDRAHPPKKENETDISLYIPDLEFPASKEQIIDNVKKSDKGKIKLFIVERISNKTFNDKDELQDDIVNSFVNNKELRDFMKKDGKDYEVIRCEILTKKDAAHRLTQLYTTDLGV